MRNTSFQAARAARRASTIGTLDKWTKVVSY